MKGSDVLTVMSTGGCSRLSSGLGDVLNRNYLSEPEQTNVYSKIVIITDRDELGTEVDFIQKINKVL